MQDWKILSVDAPLMGRDRAPDGVENVVVYRVGGRWIMLFSEGMANQHLASAESNDLIHWKPLGTVEIADQPWFAFRHGAPFVWEEYGLFYMILMGEENADHRSSCGFLSSRDGIHWECALSQE